MANVSTSKQLWLHVWRRDVISRNLPLSTDILPLDSLSGAQTKTVVTHSLRLQRTMVCAETSRLIRHVSFNQPQAVSWTSIVGGLWLLVEKIQLHLFDTFSVLYLIAPWDANAGRYCGSVLGRSRLQRTRGGDRKRGHNCARASKAIWTVRYWLLVIVQSFY